MKSATTIEELPAILRGLPTGSTIKIDGYVDSAGVVKDLKIRTLGTEDYARMKRESLRILEKNPAPVVPGFPPLLVAQARDALMKSYRASDQEPGKTFTDPYTPAEGGGFSTKEGEAAIYLLRNEDLTERKKETPDSRVDVVRAKSALVRALDLPAGRYLHTIKLSDGKFQRVTV